MVLDWIRFWLDASEQSHLTRFMDTANGLPKYWWPAAKKKETMLFQRLTKSFHQGPIAGYEVGELDFVCQRLRRQGTSLGQKSMGIKCFRAILGDSVKQAGCGELRDSTKHQGECDEQSGRAGNHSLQAQSIPILPLPFVPLNLRQPRVKAKLRGQKERYLIHANRTGRCRIQPAAQANILGTPFTRVYVTLPTEPYPAIDSEFVLNELQGGKGRFNVAKPRTLGSLVTTSLVTNSNTSSLAHLVWRDREFLDPHPILHFLLPRFLDMHGNPGSWLPSLNARTKRPITDNNQSNVLFKNCGTKNTITLVLSIQNQSYVTVELSLHAADLVVENRLGELSVEQKLIAESTSVLDL